MRTNNVHVVTVATSVKGKFNELINNRFNTKVNVLGFGEKWTGFTMKFNLVSKYIEDLDDNDIVIFLDGFDSLIMKDPEDAVRKFKNKNVQLLFSKESGNGGKLSISKYIFGSCKDNIVANVGMYMGYVKYLKLVLNSVRDLTCKDDQVLINQNCDHFNFIDIDRNNDIFQNLSDKTQYNQNATFVSYPGEISFYRILERGIFEYSQFFTLIICLVAIISLIILVKIKNRIIKLLFLSIFIFFIYILMFMDKSCMCRKSRQINQAA